MSFWLDEPRLHSTDLFLPSLPPEYQSDLLQKVMQMDTNQWSNFVDWEYLKSQLKSMSGFWDLFFTPKVVHKCIVQSHEETNPTTRIFNRLNSDDLPEPPPEAEPFRPPVAELPPALICNKQNLLHCLRVDFETLSNYAKLYDERMQKSVSLNCSFMEMIPELYVKKEMDKTTKIPCKSLLNPLHKCKGPAAATITYEGNVRDEIVSRKLNENRAEYKQMLIESLLPPSQHLCSSAVHVETTITELIKMYKFYRENEKKEVIAELQDVGCTLFYNVAAYVSDITKYYPPTRQFFSFCLEVMGQEFIRNNPNQSQPLLQTILQNPILVHMMAPNFSPNATPELFTTMYQDLIPVPVNQGPEVALTLITKFNVNAWMDNPAIGLQQRRVLLDVVSRALCQCGQRPSKPLRMVCEVSGEFSHNFNSVFWISIQNIFVCDFQQWCSSKSFFKYHVLTVADLQKPPD